MVIQSLPMLIGAFAHSIATAADSSSSTEIVVVAERAMERLLTVAAGILCIYYGFRLYAIVSTQKGAVEANARGIVLKIRDVGPGAVFCAIGCALLAWTMFTRPSLDLTSPSGTHVVYAGAIDPAASVTLPHKLATLNAVLELVADKGRTPDTAFPAESIYADLEAIKLDLIRPYASADDIATYIAFHPKDPSHPPPPPTAEQKRTLDHIEAILKVGERHE